MKFVAAIAAIIMSAYLALHSRNHMRSELESPKKNSTKKGRFSSNSSMMNATKKGRFSSNSSMMNNTKKGRFSSCNNSNGTDCP